MDSSHRRWPGFHAPPAFHRFASTALGASMWFWVFYKARQDLPHMLALRDGICLSNTTTMRSTTRRRNSEMARYVKKSD
ncbi:hypothetical protein E3P92_00181 [Wallemia ichthyophaga]|uniref:Uncharacterized protein n=1 Tax=Wallemia ichthyophaga TaxID=245174 RepID=A0A4T0JAS6_WALIC|nr:hypothetical protein E3P92_00181 [Wallemia ichthyophaga]TIB37215.1 hypothetical protein E3P84_00342 [Wallemia ichthyophaga]TIB40421.1 hypothetical protein E3P86_00694 [Wallemia ichthyophaga]TIB43744.1 hypothetical protein E3P83_00485 [Wallemia ichthyophaga]